MGKCGATAWRGAFLAIWANFRASGSFGEDGCREHVDGSRRGIGREVSSEPPGMQEAWVPKRP